MTNFTKKKFSVSAPMTKTYADNYEATFGKKENGQVGEEADRSCPGASRALSPKQSCPGLAMVSIARIELEKWIFKLEDDPRSEGSIAVDAVILWMKMVLAAATAEENNVP